MVPKSFLFYIVELFHIKLDVILYHYKMIGLSRQEINGVYQITYAGI